MKTRVFGTVKELIEFLKEYTENPDKTLDISYFKLTAVLRTKQKNRKFENESDKYFYREMGCHDSLALMKIAEKSQRPSETAWMLKRSITMLEEQKGD